MKTFLFSFIIPAWNAAPYLSEAVESVLAQSVGFRENIQLVLVNDGSEDDTGFLCARYRACYPDNVIHIDRPHAGVSAARNAGMAAARGRFFNFLDADDRWDRNACAAALAFFEAHPGINLVGFPLMHFGRTEEEHWRNRKFRGVRTADILVETDCRPNHLGSCFILAEAARRHAFDARLTVGEDLVWLAKQLLDEGRFGMSDQARYWYRKRLAQDSTMDHVEAGPERFLVLLRFGLPEILRYAGERLNTIPLWAQRAVMQSLGWMLRREADLPATPEQRQTYRDQVRACLVRIEDLAILLTPNLDLEDRFAALALKHDVSEATAHAWIGPGPGFLRLRRPGAPALPLIQAAGLRVDLLDIRAGRLELSGSLPALPLSSGLRLILIVESPEGDRRELPCALHPRPGRRRTAFFDESPPTAAFELSLPLGALAGGATIKATLEMMGTTLEPSWLHGPLSPLRSPGASLVRAGYMVARPPAARSGAAGLVVSEAACGRADEGVT